MNAPSNPAPDESNSEHCAGETAWHEAVAAYQRVRQRRDEPGRLLLEVVIEDLYAQAGACGRARRDELAALLATPPTTPLTAAWCTLLQLHAACDDATLDALDAMLVTAPPRSAWLIAAEAARLTYRAVGPQAAWDRIAAVEPVPAAESWFDDSPLVIHAVLLKLRLAAASGHWDEHDALIEPALDRFGAASDPRALRIQLACADHDIMRGCYAHALHILDYIAPHCRGDVAMAALAMRLHALVACAAQQRGTQLRPAIDHTMAELDQVSRTPSDEAYRLPADERAELVDRVAWLRDHAGAATRALAPEQVSSLADALAVEQRARNESLDRAPHEVLAALLPPVEALLRRADAAEHREAWIRLRLLWCRLIVDVGASDDYEQCELWLTEIIEETTNAGLMPLAMSAYDQRAVLRAQGECAAWDQALADAGRAGELAVTLLAQNSTTNATDSQRVIERALLGNLLPVIDRVVALLLRGACAWETHGGRVRDTWDREQHQRWQRFGRAVHDYVEQSQSLALKEARYAYGAGDIPIPHRFALAAPGQAPESPLPRLRHALRRQDAVLQYFVTGRFIAVFFYTKQHFDWVLVDAVAEAQTAGAQLDAPTAHAALLYFIAECDTWLKGNRSRADAVSAVPLGRLLVPDAICAHLDRARSKHIRVIPHDVLYRVPFGRLPWAGPGMPGSMLLKRASLSLHPTAGLAAESAVHVLKPRKRKSLGYVFGPDLANIDREQAAIHSSLGRHASLARMVAVDTAQAPGPDAVIDQIKALDMLHIACHGGRQIQRAGVRREAFMQLGTGKWKLSMVAALHLQQCALVVLQSCWTGWMEHERQHPVQGFPQALCDAGVGAVIAPLVKVPDTLTPMFAEVLYRTLRFLPAERALGKTLDVLRIHGATLVANDPAACEDWHRYGPHDCLEYRYVGHTNLHLGGGYLARFAGWLSFMRWRWQLRRGAPPEVAALPAHCGR